MPAEAGAGAAGLAASPGLVVPTGTAAPAADLLASAGLVASEALGVPALFGASAGLGAGGVWARATDAASNTTTNPTDRMSALCMTPPGPRITRARRRPRAFSGWRRDRTPPAPAVRPAGSDGSVRDWCTPRNRAG